MNMLKELKDLEVNKKIEKINNPNLPKKHNFSNLKNKLINNNNKIKFIKIQAVLI